MSFFGFSMKSAISSGVQTCPASAGLHHDVGELEPFERAGGAADHAVKVRSDLRPGPGSRVWQTAHLRKTFSPSAGSPSCAAAATATAASGTATSAHLTSFIRTDILLVAVTGLDAPRSSDPPAGVGRDGIASLRGFVRRQIRARLPALGQARFRAYPSQARADYRPTVPAAPPSASALTRSGRRTGARQCLAFAGSARLSWAIDLNRRSCHLVPFRLPACQRT